MNLIRINKIFLTLLTLIFVYAIQANEKTYSQENIWLKTYDNYKKYNRAISKVSKIETKLKRSNDPKLFNKLEIYKSKLSLYEKNKSFDTLLLKYKFDLPNINLREFLVQKSSKQLEKIIQKYLDEKNQFYLAKSYFENKIKKLDKTKDKKEIESLLVDIEYFNDYSENVEKTYQILLEQKVELQNRYKEYKDEVLTKHFFTFLVLIILYVFYKIIKSMFTKRIQLNNCERSKNYSKFLSLLFFSIAFFFIIIKYIDDLLYIMTFLGVVAAALTISLREVIMNIAGAIYIFFSSMVHVGDRIMVQFETKHTVGDILDISLIKIKLQELEDYSNVKEIKNVGRTIYIPNSYIFTKVFYNYSRKENGFINDLIEFEFDADNDFTHIETITQKIFSDLNIEYNLTFTLNNTKTAIIGIISYKTNFKEVSKTRSNISISLLKAYNEDSNIKLKTSRVTKKSTTTEAE